MYLNITFGTYILWLIFLTLAQDISMNDPKINWTSLALSAPRNPATGRPYKGQSLKRVALGYRNNVMLRKWLEGNGIRCAKTKESRLRWGRNEIGKKLRTKVTELMDGEVTQLSEITKAIGGEAYSYPTDYDPDKGEGWYQV